mgnify:CR=1 FL=1
MTGGRLAFAPWDSRNVATPRDTFRADLLILQRRSFDALKAATEKLADEAGRNMRTHPDAFELFIDAHDSAFDIDRN